MFYDRFAALCSQKGVKPGRACIEMGVSRSLAANWKSTKCKRPSADVLEKMADYFGMTIDEILGGGKKLSTPEEETLSRYMQALKTRPECRKLLELAQASSSDEVEKAIKILEALREG